MSITLEGLRSMGVVQPIDVDKQPTTPTSKPYSFIDEDGYEVVDLSTNNKVDETEDTIIVDDNITIMNNNSNNNYDTFIDEDGYEVVDMTKKHDVVSEDEDFLDDIEITETTSSIDKPVDTPSNKMVDIDPLSMMKENTEGVVLKESIEEEYTRPGGILDQFIEEEVNSLRSTLDKSRQLELEEQRKYEKIKELNSFDDITGDKDELVTFNDEDITNDGLLDVEDNSINVIDTVNEEQRKDLELARTAFKEEVKRRIQKTAKVLNKNTITIKNKILFNDEILSVVSPNTKAKRWVLYNSRRTEQYTPLSGPEITKLLELAVRLTNDIKATNEYFKIIFKHVTHDPKLQLEDWLKLVLVQDLEHIHMGLYNATFGDSKFITDECDACKVPTLVDYENIMELVRFKDDESKEIFDKLMDGTIENNTSVVESEIVMLNDKLAVGISAPTLYKVYYEFMKLGEAFLSKFNIDIGYLMYIDNLYLITDDGSLVEIEYEELPSMSPIMKIRNKYLSILKIINKLEPDDFSNLMMIIASIKEKFDNIKYVHPAHLCNGCNIDVEEKEITSAALLFTRSQLATYQTE